MSTIMVVPLHCLSINRNIDIFVLFKLVFMWLVCFERLFNVTTILWGKKADGREQSLLNHCTDAPCLSRHHCTVFYKLFVLTLQHQCFHLFSFCFEYFEFKNGTGSPLSGLWGNRYGFQLSGLPLL